MIARRAWVNIDMAYRVENQFRKRYSKLIRAEDHIARLNRLRKRRISAARRQLRRMNHDYQWLDLTRIALMQREPGVDYAVSKVPKRLIGDPGLVYERIRWRRKNRKYDSAIELLVSPENPGPRQRNGGPTPHFIPLATRKGRTKEAYALASSHQQTAGSAWRKASGCQPVALRALHRVDAFEHFTKMCHNVSYPSASPGPHTGRSGGEAGGKPEISRSGCPRHLMSRRFTANWPRQSWPPRPGQVFRWSQSRLSLRGGVRPVELVRLVKCYRPWT